MILTYLVLYCCHLFCVVEPTAGVFGQIPRIWRYFRKYNEKSWCVGASYQWRSGISSQSEGCAAAAWNCKGKFIALEVAL